MATVSASLNALNATSSIITDVASQSGAVAINIQGTFSGTITFEGTSDGQNWYAVAAYFLSAAGHLGLGSSTTTAVGQYLVPVYGFTQIRVRMSLYTSGTASVGMDTASGPLWIPGLTPSLRYGYSATKVAVSPAATPTDVLTILGSATMTVYVTKVAIAVRTSSATPLLRRVKLMHYTSGAYSLGTPTAITGFAYDSKAPTPTAVVNEWHSGLPTVGGGTAGIQQDMNLFGASTTIATGDIDFIHTFDLTLRPIVLRGTGEYVALNEAGVALLAGQVEDYYVEWEEA